MATLLLLLLLLACLGEHTFWFKNEERENDVWAAVFIFTVQTGSSCAVL